MGPWCARGAADWDPARDHVYAEGLATANLTAADMPPGAGAGLDARAINLATGAATSVNRLATLLEEIAGARPGRVRKDARAGEASPQRAFDRADPSNGLVTRAFPA